MDDPPAALASSVCLLLCSSRFFPSPLIYPPTVWQRPLCGAGLWCGGPNSDKFICMGKISNRLPRTKPNPSEWPGLPAPRKRPSPSPVGLPYTCQPKKPAKPPDGLTLYIPSPQNRRPSPPIGLPYTSQIQKTTKSRDNPPDRLTLHLPYTCPHQMHPGNPIDLPRARAPQNRGPPSPPIGLPYTYPIHARTNRPALRPRSAYPIHARTANGHNTRPAPPGGGMHRMWARWREWQQR